MILSQNPLYALFSVVLGHLYALFTDTATDLYPPRPSRSLSNNALTALNANTFKGFKSLTQLDLNDNPKLTEAAAKGAFSSSSMPKLNYMLVWNMQCPWVLSPAGGNAPKGTYCQDTN